MIFHLFRTKRDLCRTAARLIEVKNSSKNHRSDFEPLCSLYMCMVHVHVDVPVYL